MKSFLKILRNFIALLLVAFIIFIGSYFTDKATERRLSQSKYYIITSDGAGHYRVTHSYIPFNLTKFSYYFDSLEEAREHISRRTNHAAMQLKQYNIIVK